MSRLKRRRLTLTGVIVGVFVACGYVGYRATILTFTIGERLYRAWRNRSVKVPT